MAATQVGCASGLDFDRVSSGRHGADAGAPRAPDAGSVDMGVATPATVPSGAHEDAGAARSGQPAAAPAMAKAPETTAATVTRATDAELEDAGPSDAAMAAPPTEFSCATVTPKPYFCDDFESLDLAGHWSDVTVNPADPAGGTLLIDSSTARAGKSSLLAEVAEGLSVCNNCIEVRAGFTLPNLHGRIKLTAELDVRVEQIDPENGRRVVLFQVWWGTREAGFTQQTLQLWSSDGAAWAGLVEIATDPDRGDGSEPEHHPAEHHWQETSLLSEWMHVVYELDVLDALGTASMAKLTVGDLVLFNGPLSLPLQSGKAALEIGVPWVDMEWFGAEETSQAWRVRYDNVLVRYEQK